MSALKTFINKRMDIYDIDNNHSKYLPHEQINSVNTIDNDEGIEETKSCELDYMYSKKSTATDPCNIGGNISDDDTSSGFSSGGPLTSYDNLSPVSYGSIGEGGGGQVDVGSLSGLILDPTAGIMLEDDDYGDGVEDDDDLDSSPVERLQRRADCVNMKTRENVCISIPGTLHQVMESPQDVDSLMILFHKLADDQSQSVSIELIEQIPQLAVLCHEYPLQLARVMNNDMLPLIVRYVSNPTCQLRKTTQAALLVVLEQHLLNEEQVERVCGAVADLTEPHHDRTEDDRSDGLALMSRMVPILGQELMQQYFLVRFTALCADTLCQIRKICAGNFGEYTSVAGTDTTETVLLPLFVSLCKDNVWEVRRACSESFLEVSSACLPATRHCSLSPIFVSLLMDQSRWVRVAAFQNLGMFISTFAAPDAMAKRSTCYEPEDLCNSGRVTPISCTPAVMQVDDDDDDDDDDDTDGFGVVVTKTFSSWCSAPAPLLFPTETRPLSSPLPAVNVLDQHCTDDIAPLPPQQQQETADDAAYNFFNYWRLPYIDIDIDDVQLPTASPQPAQASPVALTGVHSPHYNRTAESRGDLHDSIQTGMQQLTIHQSPSAPDRRADRAQLLAGVASKLYVATTHEDKLSGDKALERASEPVSFGEVLAQAAAVGSTTAEDLLNQSDDSSDSEDTIIELSALSQGFLSSDDDDNTSDEFKLRMARQRAEYENGDMWCVADLAADIESFTACDVSHKVKKQFVVPQNLLEQYLLMTDPRRAETEEKDITRHCAFAMPAVALALGRDNWPVLRDTYLNLAQNYQWRVRRTIAYSMHQMASILGGDHAAADLLPLFKEYTVNEPECVRIGVLENLAQFVRVLPPSQRKAMLPHMKYFFGINDRRHRQEFGRQLEQLLKFYPPADCDEHLKLYCLILLTDNVVYNRQKCYGLISLLVERLGCEGDTCYVAGVCDTLCRKFAVDPTWCRRQTFVFVAGRLFEDGVVDMSLYCDHLLPQLLLLGQDRVPNVRLAVAEVLTQHIVPHDHFQDCSTPEYAAVHEVYTRLQRDQDRDVRYFAASSLSLDDVLELHKQKDVRHNTSRQSSISSGGATTTSQHLFAPSADQQLNELSTELQLHRDRDVVSSSQVQYSRMRTSPTIYRDCEQSSSQQGGGEEDRTLNSLDDQGAVDTIGGSSAPYEPSPPTQPSSDY